MTALFLSPHNDDAALFGAFTLLAEEHPHVVTVLRSKKQEAYGIFAATREEEDFNAMTVLRCSFHWRQLPEPDNAPNWNAVRDSFVALRTECDYERVHAPAVEEGGHDQHNMIGQLADEVFGDRVIHYMTYTRLGGKSVSAFEVQPLEPEHVTRKLQALAYYRSQIETVAAGCMAHFMRELREYRQ